MNNLLKQLSFDTLALDYLQAIDAKLNSNNLAIVRETFQNSSDDLIEAIIRIDIARAINSPETVNFRKVKRCKKKVA